MLASSCQLTQVTVLVRVRACMHMHLCVCVCIYTFLYTTLFQIGEHFDNMCPLTFLLKIHSVFFDVFVHNIISNRRTF